MTEKKTGKLPENPSASNPADPPVEDAFSNLEALKITPASEIKVKKRRLSLTCRKPKKTSWIRTHPDMRITALVIEVENGLDKEIFFCHPKIHSDPVVLRDSKEVTLQLTATNRHNIFLWPIPNTDNSWSETARQGAKEAEKCWIRLIPEKEEGCYSIEESEGAGRDPDWTELLDGMGMNGVLRLCFKKRLIEDEDHEVLEKLRSVSFDGVD